MHMLSVLDDFQGKEVCLEHSLSDEGKQQACVVSMSQKQIEEKRNPAGTD